MVRLKSGWLYVIPKMAISEKAAEAGPGTNKGGANRDQANDCNIDSRRVSRADTPGGVLPGLARTLATRHRAS